MTPSRVFATVVLVSSSFTFAQTFAPTDKPAPPSNPQTAAASEQWKILPDLAAREDHSQAPLGTRQFPKDWAQPNLRADVMFPPRGFVIPPSAPMDGACFAIRSYVVARDSKTSDSTHPVGYSTCVPANKYRIRKVEGSGQSLQLERGSK